MTIDFQQLLIQKQGERISELTELNNRLKAENRSLQHGGHFYNQLVKAIGDDPMLQDEWVRFISILKLSNPELPGITKALGQFS